MDFTLNEEQQAIRDTCRDFAEQEIKPLAEEMDRTGEFPYEVIRKMGELGLLGLPFPEEYGGAGADFLAYCIAIEEISRGDVSVGITMEAHTSLGASPFYLFGSTGKDNVTFKHCHAISYSVFDFFVGKGVNREVKEPCEFELMPSKLARGRHGAPRLRRWRSFRG